MNKKLVVPTILTATILVAGMFALMPVQKAETVHVAIIAAITASSAAAAAAETSVQLSTEDVGACTGAAAPTANCVAADTIGLIAGGTLWQGTVCVNTNGDGTVDLQTRPDGAAFVSDTGAGAALAGPTCLSFGGDGLWVTETGVTDPNDVDVTVVFSDVEP